MYTVYADDVLVYDQKSPDSRVHLVSPVLNMQENAAGTFECTLLPDSVGYNLFKHMKTVVSIRRDNHTIWTGRPIKETTDFYNCKKITCEGALAYLNDTIQDPVEYNNMNVRSIFQAIISAHNAKVGANDKRRFLIGSLTIQDFDDSYVFETNYNSTWTTIKTNYIDRIGGHLGLHYSGTGTTPYIDYDLEYNTSPQEINFGENLLNFSRNYDVSDLFTVIFPKGKEITADSTSSDAGDDTNVQMSTGSISRNGVSINYTVLTSDTRVTVKISGITAGSNVAYKGTHTLVLTVADETMVSRSATYTTKIVNGKTVKTYQLARLCAAYAVNTLNTKISSDSAKVTFNRGTKNTSENIVLNVFGKAYTKKITIPARDNTSEYLTGIEKKEYTTVASVNNGSVYVENTSAVAQYGRIERCIDFSDIDSPRLLLDLARIYLRSLQFDEMCLKVTAIDLHYLNPSIAGFNLLDQVRCISYPHGMDKLFPIIDIKIPLDRPDQVVYTMGKDLSSSMSTKSVINATNFYGAIQHLPSFRNTLNAAKRDMSVLLNRRTNGYVNIVQENDISQALVISDTADWLNANKLWKFDINGLGYSDSLASEEDPNYDGPSSIADGRWYKMGMTMDGTIVADVIKTGILEDGMGYNYWNLSTGEFSLQPSSVVIDNTNQYTIADMYDDFTDTSELVGQVKTTAETAKSTANYAKERYAFISGKESGVANLLNGTSMIKMPATGGGNWSQRTWRSGGGGSGTRTLVNATKATLGINPPNQDIKKAIRISGGSIGDLSAIVQDGVELEPETAYVISCYALGTGSLKFQIGAKIADAYRLISKTYQLNDVKKWKRYSFAFKTGADGKVNIGKAAGIKDGKTSVYFGNAGHTTNKYIVICGMKLEKGNTPTDWFPSIADIHATAKEFTVQYTAAIPKKAKEETAKQLEAYDKALKYDKVLKKLTDGFKNCGIYSKKLGHDAKPSLLINATYIKSGALSAGLIKTGLITDREKKNKWNLATGYFKTTNMEAVNMQATGELETGSKKSFSIKLNTGRIDGFRKGNWVCSIDPTGWVKNMKTGQIYYGLSINAKGVVDIRCPRISILNANTDDVAYITKTKRVEFECVTDVNSRIYYEKHGIDVINGLVVDVW